MFFSISKQQQNDFPNHVQWGEFFIDFDNGWTVTDSSITKGYEGKSCDIRYIDNSVRLTAGVRQTFPLFVDEENFIVSNLFDNSNAFVGSVTVTPTEIYRMEYPVPQFTNLNLTDDEIINQIDTVIKNSILNIKHNKPVKLFLTGGVDTLLLASYVVKYKVPYELVTCEHYDLDYFMCHNRSKLKKYWAYKSLQHYRTPEVLLSGSNGDEMLGRHPADVCMILNYFDEDIVEISKQQKIYHSKYFLREKFIAEYEKIKQIKFASEQELKQYIVVRNSVDFQHWHLGNTITYSPYDNLELINLVLNLSYPILKTQMLNAGVQKLLIERNAPELLRFLSDDKNSNNFEKLSALYEGIESL
jgi:asparagine synthetase B (glutamine-hydrolysing)